MALPRGAWICLQCVIVVFPDHTHLFQNDAKVGDSFINGSDIENSVQNDVNISDSFINGSGIKSIVHNKVKVNEPFINGSDI